jgi:hypothetical protein
MMRLRILLANGALGGADTEHAIDAPEGRREASLCIIVAKSRLHPLHATGTPCKSKSSMACDRQPAGRYAMRKSRACPK